MRPGPPDVRSQVQSRAERTTRARLTEPEAPLGSAARVTRTRRSVTVESSRDGTLWNVMGNGKWATEPDDATKVLDIYARMVASAATHG